MAIVSYSEIHVGRNAEDTVDDDGYKGSAVRAWWVLTSLGTDNHVTLKQSNLFPKRGNSHPNDPSLTCKRIQYRNNPDWKLFWTVEAEYDSTPIVPGIEDPGGIITFDNPFLRPALIEWDTLDHREYDHFDRNGNIIANTAGDPVTVEFMRGLDRLIITRNEPTLSPQQLRAYNNKLNSATFTGGAPGTVYCRISARRQTEGLFNFWIVRYQFDYNEKGWNPRPLNAGFNEKVYKTGTVQVGGNAVDVFKNLYQSGDIASLVLPPPFPNFNKRPIVVDNGREVNDPQPLDSYGRAIPPIANSVDTFASYIETDMYARVDFNQLGLPIP